MNSKWDDDIADDDDDDETYGGEDWTDDSDDVADTLPCPNCGAQIYEDTEVCPVCGEYISHGSSAWSDKPAWWVTLGFLGIVAVIVVLACYG